MFEDYKKAPSQFKAPSYFLASNTRNRDEDIPLRKDTSGIFIGEIESCSFEEIPKFNTVNFLVGANNSGKSRFLRGFFNTFNIILESYNNIPISRLMDQLSDHEFFNITFKNDKENEAYLQVTNFLWDSMEKFNIRRNEGYKFAHDLLCNFVENRSSYFDFLDGCKKREMLFKTKKVKFLYLDFETKIEQLIKELEFWHINYCSYKIYIPPLRSLLKCDQLEKNNLSSLAIKHLKVQKDSYQDIFTGLELYDEVLEVRNSGRSQDLREFEIFLGNNFFNGSEIELVPDLKKSNILLIRIDDESHRAINEIGDGIQAIILLLYPIYTANSKTWFFIEEPETNLHPGFQRIFIETLLDNDFLKDKNHRYFFTTHSNHFLDLSIHSDKTAIFQFKKEKENYHTIKTGVKPDKDVLDELGVNTSSVFLSNTSLWVEGPTDRKYLSRFLKLYCENEDLPYLKEDIDFAFFEYGGNLIAHYLFDDKNFEEEVREKINSFALSNRIYLLADEDAANKTTKKGKRRVLLENLSKDNDNFQYQNTELKEIENLLPKVTVKSFIKKLVKGEENITKVEGIDFNKKEYDKVDLGEFYKNLLKESGVRLKSQKAFKDESGTLKNTYKISLCDFFINSEITYEELIEDNDTLKNLIEKLYKFIKS
ncbi:AAA family ATPase [Maribacter sp.]|uniref:AAA family ATPase n=1 Tax=Maribacter sp. TaxID=1897614 RepID=UPI0025BF2607|nr:AAA family ATPase [Maribacter sp.]